MRGGEQRRAGRRGCTNWGEGGISLLGSPHQTPGQRGGPQPTAGHAGPWDGGRDLTPWQAALDPRTEQGPQGGRPRPLLAVPVTREPDHEAPSDWT